MSKDEQCIFALSEPTNGVTTVLFLMPEGAWKYMQDGYGHEFDLTNVGLPVKVVIGRCKDHADGIKMLRVNNKTLDVRSLDMRLFKKETKQ